MRKYLALIGDLKGSRQIKNRASAQIEIKKALEDINSAYAQCLTSRLTLTLGDEFQALVKPRKDSIKMLDDLTRRLFNFPFRLGLGYGSISTAIDKDLSIGADGEGYWRAREAIGYVHDNSAGGKVKTHIAGFGRLEDDLLNALFESSDTLLYGFTALQTETFHHMLNKGIWTPDFPQKPFAQSLGISQSSLTKRLNAGNIKLYLKLRNLIGTVMEEWHVESK